MPVTAAHKTFSCVSDLAVYVAARYNNDVELTAIQSNRNTNKNRATFKARDSMNRMNAIC